MKKGLRILTIALVLIIAICLLTIIAYSLDTDSPASWAVTEVEMAKELGLVPPAMQSNYSGATTRAEFCSLAVALYEKVTDTMISGRVNFTDTTDVNVEKAAYIGVVNGVGNNRFDPNASLTREQAATMLARLAESVSKPLTKQSATFADRGSIASWALEAVGQCEAVGIMGGTGNNQFSPKGAYQRQQSIATITRMYDFLGGTGTPNPITPKPSPTPTPTPPPSAGDNSVSMNALIGSWYFSGWDSTVAWAFSADGSFAYSRTYYSGQSTHFTDLKGKFRANGYTLEFFDCQIDLYTKASAWRITSEEASNLLSSTLDNPVGFDNFSGQFEFYDAMELRLQYNISTLEYDHYIQYNGSSHNVTVPTHRIPSLPWPKDLLPSDIPEYSSGRIREVYVDHRDGAIRIYVDSTTPDSFGEYCNRLLQEGWSFAYSDDSVEGVKKGYLISLERGKERIMLDGPEEDWDKNTAYISYRVVR